MYRKSGCIVKKTPFLQGKTEILHPNEVFYKNSIMYRKSGCIVKKTPFLQGKTEMLHRKRGFLQNKILLCIENIRLYH